LLALDRLEVVLWVQVAVPAWVASFTNWARSVVQVRLPDTCRRGFFLSLGFDGRTAIVFKHQTFSLPSLTRSKIVPQL